MPQRVDQPSGNSGAALPEFLHQRSDDGVGEPLPEFSQFQIKIVMQSSDAANPPLIKDLRVIALAT